MGARCVASARADGGCGVGTSHTPAVPGVGVDPHRLGWRTWMCAALVLLCSSVVSGATVPESVPLGKFVRVTLDEGEKAIVLSQDFAPVDIISADKLLAFTGLPGRYVVVVLKGDEQPQQFFTKITGVVPKPEPKPEPKPDPTVPPPTGLAGEIYALAKPINQAEKALKYANNFEVMSTEIAAGALRTLAEIQARTRQLNEPLMNPRDQRWVDVGNLIQSKIAATASVATVKEVFDAAVIGLRAAGGVQ